MSLVSRECIPSPITNYQIQVKTDHAKVAASNEALSLEFGTQPLQLDTKTASKLQQPAQSAAGTAVAAPAAEAPDAAKKRSAAEALAGLVASSASSAGAAQALAPGAAASVDPLSDYHRMKAKSNRLTPQDDERIRLFYLHGTQGNPHPEQREVKIKINEEEVTKDDGSRVKETLYIALNYDTRKAVLVCQGRVPVCLVSSDYSIISFSPTRNYPHSLARSASPRRPHHEPSLIKVVQRKSPLVEQKTIKSIAFVSRSTCLKIPIACTLHLS